MNNIFKNGLLQQIFIHIRSSLWFTPALVILGAVCLAMGLIEIDSRFHEELRQWSPRLFATEAEGARGMLSAIATSMATVAGVVFSITIVALALASTQYTPRVLRNFMRDRANQVVLGVFVGIYLYCLLVLRTISGGEWAFVPSSAVLVAVLLAIVGVGFFIFFIHHISSAIQASEIAAAITRETASAIDRMFPEEVGDEADHVPPNAILEDTVWQPIPSSVMGYIQSVNAEALLALAREHKTVIRMECAIGEFIAPGRPIASLALAMPPNKELIDAINSLYATGNYRTIDQDAAFGIRQLVDVALKALSPGINDTTTAVTCIEHLSMLLSKCAQRRIAASFRFEDNELRVIARGPSFAYLISLAFDQILENAEGNTEVLVRMLTALAQISQETNNPYRLEVLKSQVAVIAEVAKRSAKSTYAALRIDQLLRNVALLLDPETRRFVKPYAINDI